jgi:hypothetical protein
MSDVDRTEGVEGRPSKEESAAFQASLADRDRTLEALRTLEEALGAAAPGREPDWFERVIEAFKTFESVLSSERHESLQPDSLMSMISRGYPRRFGSRVRQLRDEHDTIATQVASMRTQLEGVDREAVDFSDLRQRLGWVMRAVHHRRARETDLVFEAINLDLGRSAPG